MHPPFSMIFFTTLAGAAQGLLIALVGLDVAVALGNAHVPPVLFVGGAAIVLALSAAGLVAATFHLGHPMRAWRAVAMWRTSWLSREVIVLPAFMAMVLGWGALHVPGGPRHGALAFGLAAAVLAIVLYVCTGMIYAAVKAIREWAHPITPTNYLVLGLASGLLLAAALAALVAPGFAMPYAGLALAATLVGAATRGYALRRNLTLVPKTTLQSAIGVRHPRIAQKSQGAMGGSFNTREFFHGRSDRAVRTIRWSAALLGFVVPSVLLVAAATLAGEARAVSALLAVTFVVQYVGLLAERWSFFAEGQHPQNLYYRSIA